MSVKRLSSVCHVSAKLMAVVMTASGAGSGDLRHCWVENVDALYMTADLECFCYCLAHQLLQSTSLGWMCLGEGDWAQD